jgi:hypothetical protein
MITVEVGNAFPVKIRNIALNNEVNKKVNE